MSMLIPSSVLWLFRDWPTVSLGQLPLFEFLSAYMQPTSVGSDPLTFTPEVITID